MPKHHRPTEEDFLKAISHPLRHRILVILNESGPSSAIKIAAKLGVPAQNISYHINVLRDLGTIELASKTPRRGATELTYRAVVRPHVDEDHWTRLPLSARRHLQDQSLQKMWEHVVEAAEANTLDEPRTHLSWVNLDLDEEGFDAVARILNQALEDAIAVQAEVAGREVDLREDERETTRTELAMMHYVRTSSADQLDAKVRRPRRRKRTRT